MSTNGARRLSRRRLLQGAGGAVLAVPLLESLPRAGKPVALVLGNEELGLPRATLAACETIVTIPGSGAVQSLNVAASAAILLHALARMA